MSDNKAVVLVIPNQVRYLPLVGSCVVELCALDPRLGAEAVAIQLAVHEACTNVIEHAHGGEPLYVVRLEFSFDVEALRIYIYDQGDGFDPTVVPEPDPEALQERGYGVMIMRNVMDDVSYERGTAWGNRLTLTKRYGKVL